MKFFQLNIGDYAEATSHLSFLEDAAYCRMLRKYYATEQPLPADIHTVQRLMCARTRAEKAAIVTVLEEFFVLEEDGWHNARCDDEIAKYREMEGQQENRGSSQKERVRRYREERSRLFRDLKERGVSPKWNISMNELRSIHEQTCNAPVTQPVTDHGTDTDALPVTQAVTACNALQVSESTPENKPSRAVEIAVLLRKNRVRPMSGSHPLAVEWAQNPRITDQLLSDALQAAAEYKPQGNISPNYLKPIIDGLLNPPDPSRQRDSPKPKWYESASGIEQKGREIGITALPGESFPDFKRRIFEKMKKLEQEGTAA